MLNRDESVKLFIESQYNRLNKWLNHVPIERYKTRFIELDDKGYVWKDKVYQRLVDEFNITAVTWEELLLDYISHFHSSCVPFPNLISTLEKLKGHNLKLGMITNGKGKFQMDTIKALGIERYFETILISEWEGMKKPDRKIFEKCLKYLNVLPSQTIYVGDHPVNDVAASKKAGMKGVWKRNSQGDNVKADFIVEDLEEIPLIIDKLRN